MANLQLIAAAAEKGVSIRLLDEANEVYAVCCDSMEIPRKESCYLSVFSASDISEGVSESGVKYLLDNVTLSRSFRSE